MGYGIFVIRILRAKSQSIGRENPSPKTNRFESIQEARPAPVSQSRKMQVNKDEGLFCLQRNIINFTSPMQRRTTRNHLRGRSKRAFSLFELLMVMAIIPIIAATQSGQAASQALLPLNQ